MCSRMGGNMKAYQRVALEHLRRLLEGSGLSVARFARDVMGRDPRTLQRWLSGEIAIPQSAAQWLGRVAAINYGAAIGRGADKRDHSGRLLLMIDITPP